MVTYDSFTAGREGRHSTAMAHCAEYRGADPDQPVHEGWNVVDGGDDQNHSKGNLCDSVPLYQRCGTHEGGITGMTGMGPF